MDVGAISANSLDLQSLLLNGSNNLNRVNSNDALNQTATYAKKGEPMYMADMDSDEDGVVTLDEFKDYCKSKGISTKSMVKMSQMASAFRTMEAESATIDYISKLIPNAFPKLKEADSNSGSLRGSEYQYNISNDENVENKVSYKKYMEYCEQNVVPNELKSNAEVKDADGKLEIANSGKALLSYEKNEGHSLESTFETVV